VLQILQARCTELLQLMSLLLLLLLLQEVVAGCEMCCPSLPSLLACWVQR
jgi:hypothetical protein